VASCELPGIRGQQHGKIRFGTMLRPCCVSYVYCFTPAYFSKGKVENKKNWETNLILGVAMAKSS